MRRRIGEFLYKHQNGIESLIVAALVGALVVSVCALVVAAGYWASENGCATQGEELGLETDYRFWSNVCYAELEDGRRVNVDSIRATSEGVALPGESQ